MKIVKRKKEVMKHSSAVQITNSISLLQRRAWNILLARAFDELSSSDRYHIRVRELVEMLDYQSHDDSHLKEALEKLTTTAVKWNILGKDKSCEWGVFPLLAGAVIKQGVLTYAFSPFLKERLHHPQMYARISLSLQNKFQSKHALALYELCLDYFDIERDYGETPFIPLFEFRELMGVDEDEYAEFARFNEKVIKRAVQEINTLSDLYVTPRFERNKRKIDTVKFCIHRKTELTLPFESLDVAVPVPLQAGDYDAIFMKLSTEEQHTILLKAFHLLPDLVKQYDANGQPMLHDKLTRPLLMQLRNELLAKVPHQVV
jgi:plasmid replication initiation protein